jgi:hypothetical protein
MSNSASSFGRWLAGILATVIGALIIWSLTRPGGPMVDNPPPTLVPPTPTALFQPYVGLWSSKKTASQYLSSVLYRLIIDNVNAQTGTATFSVCRCTQYTCQNKNQLVPSFASAKYDGTKLVAEQVDLDQNGTVYWNLYAIKDGQTLVVTVKEYRGDKEQGEDEFVLDRTNLKPPQLAALTATPDECQQAPEYYSEMN